MCRGLNIVSTYIALRHIIIMIATTRFCYMYFVFSFRCANMWQILLQKKLF
jgi:hypothetical protein